MARTDDDSWDLATSVVATATMVAAYRAVATKKDDPVIRDPFAEPLVRAVGMPFFSRMAGGDWPTALRGTGFDPAEPTAWLAEGLLIGFLPPEAHDRLLDNITALSATGSRFAADYVWSMSQLEAGRQRMRTLFDRWREEGVDIDLADLTYSGDRNDVADYLEARGWVAARAGIADLFASAGLPAVGGDELETASWIVYVAATRT